MDVASLPKWVLATCLVLIVLFVGYSAVTGVHFDWTPSIGFSQGLLRLKGTTLKTVGPFTVGANNGWQTNANGNLALSAINTQVDQGNGICFLTFLQDPLKPGAKVGFDFVSAHDRWICLSRIVVGQFWIYICHTYHLALQAEDAVLPVATYNQLLSCQAPTDAVDWLLRLIRAIQTVRYFAVRQARVFFQQFNHVI